MIYFYKHHDMNNLSHSEINLLGYSGVAKYAFERNLDPNEVFAAIKQLEQDIKLLEEPAFSLDDPANINLLNKWENYYIDYFNHGAKYDKQAYILLGNIACGKSTYAKKIEEQTGSIIIDPDRYKMGEQTSTGFFEGFTSLYKKPTDRERMQDLCGDAAKKTLRTVADLGMNLILPKATASYSKLEKQLSGLIEKNYDIHLILFDTPIKDCADRNYYRYLIKEYQRQQNPNEQSNTGGRFVPVSVITNIGDHPYEVFATALENKRFTSYKAFFNSKNTDNEEIDINTMER